MRFIHCPGTCFRYRMLFLGKNRPRKKTKTMWAVRVAAQASKDSVQKFDLNKSSSLKNQDSRENARKKLKDVQEIPEFTRIHKNSWTQFSEIEASVPKNPKEDIWQAGTNQSELSWRDETTRKKGFCTETGESHLKSQGDIRNYQKHNLPKTAGQPPEPHSQDHRLSRWPAQSL